MFAIFCLRLACGLLGCLPLLSPAQVNPRFFRTHFLTALGLCVVALVLLHASASLALWLTLAAAIVLTFLGSIVWLLEGAPGSRWLLALALPAVLAALALTSAAQDAQTGLAWLWGDDVTSAALLGSAMTAMLMGHSYLITPAMSLTPLLRLLAAIGASALLRMVLAAAGLWCWTGSAAPATVETETVLLLVVRWALGFVGPLVLGWMAFETAKIRSTQSATGILYVVVILCFLGELTSQLLLYKTSWPL
jgi:hypothetical protein